MMVSADFVSYVWLLFDKSALISCQIWTEPVKEESAGKQAGKTAPSRVVDDDDDEDEVVGGSSADATDDDEVSVEVRQN